MTVKVISTRVLASNSEMQDVIHADPMNSICEAIIQMTKTSIESRMPYLLELPRSCMIDSNGKCKFYKNIICEEFAIDEDSIRSEFSDGDLEFVSDYVNDLINNGPVCGLCIWCEFRDCLKGDSE